MNITFLLQGSYSYIASVYSVYLNNLYTKAGHKSSMILQHVVYNTHVAISLSVKPAHMYYIAIILYTYTAIKYSNNTYTIKFK